ncbi:hypothetical protein C8R46DRAFT_1228314 [Mycena filopes]|nr:hypothetical protein C8R46DRAFT_1228314 [Mycena filopes]
MDGFDSPPAHPSLSPRCRSQPSPIWTLTLLHLRSGDPQLCTYLASCDGYYALLEDLPAAAYLSSALNSGRRRKGYKALSHSIPFPPNIYRIPLISHFRPWRLLAMGEIPFNADKLRLRVDSQLLLVIVLGSRCVPLVNLDAQKTLGAVPLFICCHGGCFVSPSASSINIVWEVAASAIYVYLRFSAVPRASFDFRGLGSSGPSTASSREPPPQISGGANPTSTNLGFSALLPASQLPCPHLYTPPPPIQTSRVLTPNTSNAAGSFPRKYVVRVPRSLPVESDVGDPW